MCILPILSGFILVGMFGIFTGLAGIKSPSLEKDADIAKDAKEIVEMCRSIPRDIQKVGFPAIIPYSGLDEIYHDKRNTLRYRINNEYPFIELLNEDDIDEDFTQKEYNKLKPCIILYPE